MAPPATAVPGRPLIWVVLAAGLVAAVVLVPSGAVQRAALDVVLLALSAGAVACGVGAARAPAADRANRRAWSWLSAGFTLCTVSICGFGIWELTSAGPVVVIATALRLAAMPVLLTGLLILPARRSRHDRYKTALDSGIVTAAGLLAVWYFLAGPAMQHDHLEPVNLVFAAAYPTGDLLLAFGALNAAMRAAGTPQRRPALLLAAGSTALICGDLYLSRLNTAGAIALPTIWPMIFWILGTALFALAGAARRRLHASACHSTWQRSSRITLLPYLAVATVYLMLLPVAVGSAWYPWGGLLLGVGLMTALVLWRQLVVLRDNRELLITDPLTRLSNRLHLHEALRRALDSSDRTGAPSAVLMIDMNGFKDVNDTFGHEAGDALLVGFARILRRSVLGSDVAGRLGGDEFAVVLHRCDAAGAAAVVERIRAAMREPVRVADRWIVPRASIGIAVRPAGGVGLDQLLHEADTAMYQDKQRSRHPSRSRSDQAQNPRPTRTPAKRSTRRVHVTPSGA